MSLFGTQKLGQSVIDTTVPVVIETEVTVSPFKKNVVGAGTDERESILSEDEEENEFATLSKIDKTFRQRKLLGSLSSPSLSQSVKFEMVSRASSVENLLPGFLSSKAMSSSNLKAGGLQNDWDFNFE